jgi:hypothetical protein
MQGSEGNMGIYMGDMWRKEERKKEIDNKR